MSDRFEDRLRAYARAVGVPESCIRTEAEVERLRTHRITAVYDAEHQFVGPAIDLDPSQYRQIGPALPEGEKDG